eukprot:3849112-Amphidinium_carterae.1
MNPDHLPSCGFHVVSVGPIMKWLVATMKDAHWGGAHHMASMSQEWKEASQPLLVFETQG